MASILVYMIPKGIHGMKAKILVSTYSKGTQNPKQLTTISWPT